MTAKTVESVTQFLSLLNPLTRRGGAAISIKGGGALRRLWEKNFEAIVLVPKIGLGG